MGKKRSEQKLLSTAYLLRGSFIKLWMAYLVYILRITTWEHLVVAGCQDAKAKKCSRALYYLQKKSGIRRTRGSCHCNAFSAQRPISSRMTNWPILGDAARCFILRVRRPCARVASERVPAAYTQYARIARRGAETRSDQKETALC